MIHPSQANADALVAAGGCTHTLDPFVACDTCGRPAIPGRAEGVVAYNFQAITIDGRVLDKRDVISFKNLPLDRVCQVKVLTDDPHIPTVTVNCDPRKGERLYMFTRHAVRTSMGGMPTSKTSVVVLEIRQQEDVDHFVRLYMHPQRGPILSTQDLYF